MHTYGYMRLSSCPHVGLCRRSLSVARSLPTVTRTCGAQREGGKATVLLSSPLRNSYLKLRRLCAQPTSWDDHVYRHALCCPGEAAYVAIVLT
jgi:hypothetical protein